MSFSDREAVELFHLIFIRSLLTGPEKAQCVIKGGCNLRLFFGSVRYSADVDFDVGRITPTTLKKNVGRVLGSPLMSRSLAACGLEIEAISTPKQTETTQRWKVALRQTKHATSLHTKIEFSRRDSIGDAPLEAVSSAIVEHYHLPPILACHYSLPTAIGQKVHALARRATTQARDIFDLSVLFARTGGNIPKRADLAAEIEKAVTRALALSFGDFEGQVGAFLTPDDRALYSSVEAWEAMQLQVVDGLERMRP
jgi:predicted nucleotidyltransferase component of viral defense system